MRRLSVLLVASTALAAAHAYAAPVFMLQFGSFETRTEAEEKLTALKTKHAGVLSRMEASVRDVQLPPDNLTVYRTQAGPLATRADAQSVCSQLTSNGDECYVVETAMMQPATAPRQQTADAPQPMPTAPQASASATPTPVTAAQPAPQATAVVPTEAANPLQPQAAPNVRPVPQPYTRDAGSMAMINRVTAEPMPEPPSLASTQQATASQADAMHQELAQAAERQREPNFNPQPSPFASSAVGVSPATTATQIAEEEDEASAPVKKEGRSLWDRLFGSDESEAVSPEPLREPQLVAAPVEPVQVTATPEPTAMPWENEPTMMPQPPVAPQPVMAAAAPQPVMQQPAAANPPVITEAAPFPLPPPPEPLKARTSVMSAPVMASPSGNMALAEGNGNVRVEDAQRVPLSAAQMPATATAPNLAPPMVNSAPAAATGMPMSLSPSATVGQKTLWAQIGGFADAQSALAFWDQYRSQHPDFPVVRVRVTSPLIGMLRGNQQVFLRVGPFARQGFIQNLCSTVPQEQVQCGSITDMGVASSGERRRGFLPQSRYNR